MMSLKPLHIYWALLPLQTHPILISSLTVTGSDTLIFLKPQLSPIQFLLSSSSVILQQLFKVLQSLIFLMHELCGLKTKATLS